MANQEISNTQPGPIVGNGGNITVTPTGKINGNPLAVDAGSAGIAALVNRGEILGGDGGAVGGAGVSNVSGGSLQALTNTVGATISGGGGGFSGAGGAGVLSSGLIPNLTNAGHILGGLGGHGSITGGAGGAGISNSLTITTLANAGAIAGGAGGGGHNVESSGGNLGGAGGAGVANADSATIQSLTNSALATITGGSGGAGASGGGFGGAGASNAGTIAMLSNSGTIAGGAGASLGGSGGAGVMNSGTIANLSNASGGSILGGSTKARSGLGTGGSGVLNSGTITTLTNSGTIQGGGGALGGTGLANVQTIVSLMNFGVIGGGAALGVNPFGGAGGAGGAGLSNGPLGAIATLTNAAGAIITGGVGGLGAISSGGLGGSGGAGVLNAGTVTLLTNSGVIVGGAGGGETSYHAGGAGGAGLFNTGAIGNLTNIGSLAGGPGGIGSPTGSPGDAIYSAGFLARIVSITNTGEILGNVEVDNQANLTIYGGAPSTFGLWSQGAITVGSGGLTFAAGATTLDDDVSLSGGAGTMINSGALELTARHAVLGNFIQTSSGVTDIALASSVHYGALTFSGAAPEISLSGGLNLNLTSGFTLASGDDFKILSAFSNVTGDFTGVSVDGVALNTAAGTPNVWLYGGDLKLTLVIGPTDVDVLVSAICFMPGTMIATPRGEVAVETLKAGDLVTTSDGAIKAVNWLGRQTLSRRFCDPLRAWPIRILAGALGENVPSRDLRLSPDHALLVEGALVQAGALVNGTSIRRETQVPETWIYYHIELDDHSLVLAEGAPAETFVDNIDRLAFDNWDEFEALYPEGKIVDELPYPRVKAQRQVSRNLRALLARRALAIGAARADAAA